MPNKLALFVVFLFVGLYGIFLGHFAFPPPTQTQIVKIDSQRVEAPAQKCMNTSVANNWHVGDLCDTLPPMINVTVQRWDHFNRLNGWGWVGENPRYSDSGHCWKTTTTNEPYVLCFDGTVMKIG